MRHLGSFSDTIHGMTEVTQLISAIKQQLRSQGLTYRDVATALDISEPSVKRLFASGRFTLDRLVRISNLLGFTLAELSKEAAAREIRVRTLIEKQERELVSDSKLLLVTVCVLNGWTIAEILKTYRISETECLKRLLRLDKLRLIDLLPGNRIRINISRDFEWLPFGPISQYFRHQGQSDFLDNAFTHGDEALVFVHGMLTEQASTQLLAELHRLRQKFAELHEMSLSAPLAKRQGRGLLVASRGWEPAAFSKLRR